MHADRLQRMADLLRRDAANPNGVRFDLGSWASPADAVEGVPSIRDEWALPSGIKIAEGYKYQTGLAPIEVPVSCSTFACAFGLAAISGEFAKEGLSYTIVTLGLEHVGDSRVTFEGATGTLLPAIMSGDRMVDGFEAATVLFDISPEDATYFFDPDSYDGTPRHAEGEIKVAERIEAFIRGEIDEDYHPDFRSSDED